MKEVCMKEDWLFKRRGMEEVWKKYAWNRIDYLKEVYMKEVCIK